MVHGELRAERHAGNRTDTSKLAITQYSACLRRRAANSTSSSALTDGQVNIYFGDAVGDAGGCSAECLAHLWEISGLYSRR